MKKIKIIVTLGPSTLKDEVLKKLKPKVHLVRLNMSHLSLERLDYDLKMLIKKGGFVRCGWDGTRETEDKIKQDTKATIRCIPFDENIKNMHCIYSNAPAKHEVLFARSY